jgi:death-on-curing protein
LSAAYGFALASNLPFNDANKRTALVSMRLFLKVNGFDLRARPEEKYNIIIRAAGSDAMEVELAQWIASNLIDLT